MSGTEPALYQGTGVQEPQAPYTEREWPAGPPWRTFDTEPSMPEPPDDREADRRLGPGSIRRTPPPDEVRMVNAALLLRRPLLVTGRPGVGKSGLAYRIARELRLGRVLHWPITSRTTLTSGLYEYDAIGRAQAAHEDGNTDGVGSYVQLGPLGTALLPYRLPRVLLIDELDKCDMDLPNDLLTVFEDGRYSIPPLVRTKRLEPRAQVHTADPGGTAEIEEGEVRCHAFPVVVMTSNGEREFPEAFMRRCLRLEVRDPGAEALGQMVGAHFGDRLGARQQQLIEDFLRRREEVGGLAADQLLNAVHLVTSGHQAGPPDDWEELLTAIWHPLGDEGAGQA
ncbi:ATPase AAA [Streptomyces sp. NBRC 14336]|uniref:AAA family ATPase n=1 Tax=Streptomyces sp. NBRC 14336 TaxID=3030992 RepID=UPI0024A36580|nr:MoxR family ATPase [Streptomyces sp. NBRC 14336]WBO77902.1 MoxR family ATPase [Streptomyces sp. SBE_14.2]GLW45743.1 ATPase AAA [Streptomyces sp. NBRC 14336]